MFCRNCGSPMSDQQAVCLNCGVNKGVGTNYCPNCGQPVNPAAAVCVTCGVALHSAPAGGNGAYLNGKDKVTIILVCLFLGGLGIHNFMMGETKKGVARIIGSFLCGIGGILALIDLIKIITDKYVVDPNKLF